jgi:regulator of protease activity HflC (stomatin/prohibitin superfamily)
MLLLGILVGAIACSIYFSLRCFFRVEQGHVGVLSTFGAAKKTYQGELVQYPPGLHFKWPWQRVHSVAMMEQSLELSGEDGGRTAMADDGTILRFDSILRFQPVPNELDHFLFDLKSPHEHITGLFTCLLRNEIANFQPPPDLPASDTNVGAYASIRRQRALLNRRIEEFCRTLIGTRYGVQFNAVDLTDVLPPDELADALNAVINAQTEAKSIYAHAEAETQQRIVAAEAGVEVAKSRGLAVEREIATLGSFLKQLEADGTLDDYVARRRAEVISQSKTLYMRSSS